MIAIGSQLMYCFENFFAYFFYLFPKNTEQPIVDGLSSSNILVDRVLYLELESTSIR